MSPFHLLAFTRLRVPRSACWQLVLWLMLLGGSRAWGQATTLSTLSELNRKVAQMTGAGKYQEALPVAQRALTLAKRQPNKHPQVYAETLNNLAMLYENMGRYAEAEPLYKQALGEHHPDHATYLTNLAGLYKEMGRYAEAEPLYKQGLAVNKQALGEHHPDYARDLTNLASIYFDMGRYAEAEQFLKQALAIDKQALGEQHPTYAIFLNNLAGVYKSTGRYAEAVPLLEQALAIYRQVLGEHHPTYALYLNNLAMIYKNMGHYVKAEALFEPALAIYKQALGEQHPTYARFLSNLAMLYKDTKRHAKAEALFDQALGIDKQVLGERHPTYATDLNNLAVLYASTGRRAAAQSVSAQATTILLRHLRETFAGLSEREQRQLLATVSNSVERYHSFLQLSRRAAPGPLDVARSYDHVLFTKGLLLASTAGMQRQVLASGDTALTRRFGRWQGVKRQLASARALPPAQQQKRSLDPAQLEQQANALEKDLTAQSAAFRRGGGLPTATWQQVQQALRSGEAAIELVRYRWFRSTFTDTIHYAAYVLTPGSKTPQMLVLQNGNALEEQYLPAYRRLTHAPRGGNRGAVDVNAAAATSLADPKVLYDAFWAPIAASLPPGTRTVYLSADGVYQQLNLATLRNKTRGRYLLDKLDLRLVGSTRELIWDSLDRADPRQAAGGAVLVGAPAYRLPGPITGAPPAGVVATPRSTYSRSEGYLPSGEVPPLPGTAQEIAALEALFTKAHWPRRAYTEAAATEEAVGQVRRPRVLHLATHGFFVPETRAGMAEPSQALSAAQAAAASDPMLRSSLLLAGVSNFRDATVKPATEDGILTAYEASLLDLQGTELVVLSACETGLGQVQAGEGVYGLQRGFAVAGARTIMMSLWKVDDAVTHELMTAFYRFWLAGSSKRAALLAAQQQIRRKHPDPYYWGAFVLVGE